jgi:hypothetical protein
MSPVKYHQARTVPIPAIVSEELATFRADHKPSDLVFPSANRTPLLDRNFRRDVYDDAVEDLGLDITPHNLRDTAASLAIQAGASVVAVARLLGHESAATTLNHYPGFFPTDLYDVASRLNAAARVAIAHQRAQEDRKVTTQDLRRAAAAGSDLDDPEVTAAAWDETEYLLRSPENARRLREAIARLDASHGAPPDTTQAPTKHRPEQRGVGQSPGNLADLHTNLVPPA